MDSEPNDALPAKNTRNLAGKASKKPLNPSAPGRTWAKSCPALRDFSGSPSAFEARGGDCPSPKGPRYTMILGQVE